MGKYMKKETKNIILEAAKDIFIEKGYAGARMRDIAERAGINKGLLHYYYKTKKIMFVEVLKFSSRHIFPKLNDIMVSEIKFNKKLELIVDVYIELLSQNIKLPSFVINEMNYNTEIFINSIFEAGLFPDIPKIGLMISKDVEEYNIENFDPFNFVLNGLSMILFPFLLRPVLNRNLNINDKEFINIMRLRKRFIVDTLINGLKN